MIITKLKTMPYAQAKVQQTNEGIALISYATCVATIDNEGWLTVNGLYSMTTRKHLSAFAKEYCATDYSTIKTCYEKQYKYNIYTKEFYNTKTGEVWTA